NMVLPTDAASFANYTTLHLYRGELFVTPGTVKPGMQLGLLTRADFSALELIERETLLGRLELDERYCLEKWERGDQAVLARRDGRPAGIGWFARARSWQCASVSWAVEGSAWSSRTQRSSAGRDRCAALAQRRSRAGPLG
ncbi:MAG TPA: hypothetical protein PLP28_03775, partial [Flavobacteriales bacterium]|nr:hypothetical protein [Flavobacteriales bacterium]